MKGAVAQWVWMWMCLSFLQLALGHDTLRKLPNCRRASFRESRHLPPRPEPSPITCIPTFHLRPQPHFFSSTRRHHTAREHYAETTKPLGGFSSCSRAVASCDGVHCRRRVRLGSRRFQLCRASCDAPNFSDCYRKTFEPWTCDLSLSHCATGK